MVKLLMPVLIIVLSNCFYHICAKSTPPGVNAFGALLVTYLTAAAVTAVLFAWGAGDVRAELSKINWTSFVLGLAIVGLEIGTILLYRAGWKISTGALVANTCLACALIFIGALLYGERISLQQVLGIGLCLAGLALIKG